MTETSIGDQIVFSVVIAVYNNENYAHDLYRSIDGQTIDRSILEIVIIDDGSTDSSLQLAREWQTKTDLQVHIITKENGGVSSARNYGIENATGTWITFIDSDDVLHPDYFSALSEFIRRDSHDRASMLSSRSVIFLEDQGTTIDNHPLSWKYKQGDRLVSMNLEPHVVHLGGHSTIVRRHVVMEEGIRFNGQVRPGFEDADFNGRYLAQFNEPILGLVSSARYFYRKRSDGSSLIDTAWTKVEKFTHEPKYGHLGMLRYVTDQRGYTPVWAQNTVLYGLYWYFSADRSWRNPLSTVPQPILDEFWETLREIFTFIDASTIRSFPIKNLGWYLSEGLLRYFKNESWVESKKTVVYQWGGVDKRSLSQKFVYSYVGTIPKEKFYVNGIRVQPLFSKSVRHNLFGHPLMNERVIGLPADSHVSVELNGKRAFLSRMPPANRLPKFLEDVPDSLVLTPGKSIASPHEQVAQLRKASRKLRGHALTTAAALRDKGIEEAWVTESTVRQAEFRIVKRSIERVRNRYEKRRLKLKNRKTVALALTSKRNSIYESSWIFLDRPDRADDNAEHLYRYAKLNHPEINSWFMIRKTSSDWDRLANEGFRLIPYGEDASIPACLKASFILSSHLDTEVYDPIDRNKYGRVAARRIFLQHGITMNDISRWINTKDVAMVSACSDRELEAFVADETNYRLMRQQLRVTGFPRHDRLIELAHNRPVANRPNIMVVPTWRKGLSEELIAATSEADRLALLTNSEFYQAWSALLTSEKLTLWAKELDLNIVFALHDHLSAYSSLFEFGDSVEVHPFSEISMQEMLTSSRSIITDYSSLGVEAAVGGASVIYYQFDGGSIYDGGHTFEKSWFSYSDHGVGPVVATTDEVIEQLHGLELRSWCVPDLYTKRLRELVLNLDGTASARVMQEVLKLR